jgi:hypothetical protein
VACFALGGDVTEDDMIKARKLSPGDKVAAISLSWGGPGQFLHRYEAGKRQLQEEFGLEVVETRHALRDPKWLHRNPRARAEDLMEAFGDPAVSGVVSTIGGDDSIRLLPYLDPDVFRSNPKVFLGYSDTTVTHLALFKADLATFYGRCHRRNRHDPPCRQGRPCKSRRCQGPPSRCRLYPRPLVGTPTKGWLYPVGAFAADTSVASPPAVKFVPN